LARNLEELELFEGVCKTNIREDANFLVHVVRHSESSRILFCSVGIRTSFVDQVFSRHQKVSAFAHSLLINYCPFARGNE